MFQHVQLAGASTQLAIPWADTKLGTISKPAQRPARPCVQHASWQVTRTGAPESLPCAGSTGLHTPLLLYFSVQRKHVSHLFNQM
jgi:hypothetical protein